MQDGPGCAEGRRYARWFADRLDAMWLLRKAHNERMTTMTTTPDIAEARRQAQSLRCLDIPAYYADTVDALCDELGRLRAQVSAANQRARDWALLAGQSTRSPDVSNSAPGIDMAPSLTVGERDRFEADIRARLKLTPAYFSRDPNGYANEIVEASWQGWQARAAQPAAQAEPVAIVYVRAEVEPGGHGRWVSWLTNPVALANETKLYTAPPSHTPAQGVAPTDALNAALALLTGSRWGTVPYMDGTVYEDAAAVAKQIRAALAQAQKEQP